MTGQLDKVFQCQHVKGQELKLDIQIQNSKEGTGFLGQLKLSPSGYTHQKEQCQPIDWNAISLTILLQKNIASSFQLFLICTQANFALDEKFQWA